MLFPVIARKADRGESLLKQKAKGTSVADRDALCLRPLYQARLYLVVIVIVSQIDTAEAFLETFNKKFPCHLPEGWMGFIMLFSLCF